MSGDTLLVPVTALLALAGLDSTNAGGDRPLSTAATLLHADASFDPAALVVQFADSGTLPVSRRATRARMRAQLRERELDARTPVASARAARSVSAIAVDYSAERDGALAIDAASRLFGGAAEASITRQSDHRMRSTLRWTSVPPGSHAIRVQFGALDELAGATGVLFTNAPVQRADTLRALSIAPAVLPGAELELFEDGALVAADSAGADVSRLRFPHRYGTHRMRLVVSDPDGGERESRWVESTPDALLPRGAVRYTLAAGACPRLACSAATARVAYAATDRVTVGVGWAPTLRHATVPVAPALHLTLDARIGQSAALSLERGSADGASADGASVELRVDRAEGRSIVLRSEATGVRRSVSPLLPVAMGAMHRVTSVMGSWMLPRSGIVDLASAVTRSALAFGSAVSLPTPLGVVQGSSLVQRDGVAAVCAGGSIGAVIYGTWLPRALAPLRPMLVRVRAEQYATACERNAARSVTIALPVALSAVELSASWDGARGPRRAHFGVALRRRIGSIMAAHAEVAGGAGAPSARSGVAGSVLVDRLRRSISFGASASGSASVHGVVYADANANGRRDPGEVPVAGALVRSGDVTAVSDERGVFVLQAVPSDQSVRVTVDSLSVEDAGLVPGVPLQVVLTARGMVRVDIPLHRRVGGAP